MNNSLNGLSGTEPVKSSSSKFYGAFSGEVKNATVLEKKEDKNGKPYYKVYADVFYDQGGTERSKKIFGALPYDWKNNDKPFGSLYSALGTVWESLLENFDKETNKKVTVFIGAQKNWKTGLTETYDDKSGIKRISYGVIGFSPFVKDPESAWNDAMESHEQNTLRSFQNVKRIEVNSDIDSLTF